MIGFQILYFFFFFDVCTIPLQASTTAWFPKLTLVHESFENI